MKPVACGVQPTSHRSPGHRYSHCCVWVSAHTYVHLDLTSHLALLPCCRLRRLRGRLRRLLSGGRYVGPCATAPAPAPCRRESQGLGGCERQTLVHCLGPEPKPKLHRSLRRYFSRHRPPIAARRFSSAQCTRGAATGLAVVFGFGCAFVL